MSDYEARAASERLNKSGKEILESVNRAYAQATALEHAWDVKTAIEARRNLCQLLKSLLNDGQFWADLAEPVKSLDQRVVEQVLHMNLYEFETFEIRTFLEAGVARELAGIWAAEARRLLFVVRLGFDGRLPDHLQPDIDRAKASVETAHDALCVRNPPLNNPKSASAKRKGWKTLWGGLGIASGVGGMGVNGGLLLAGIVTGGVSAIFGGGTVLGGFWAALEGAKYLEDIRDD